MYHELREGGREGEREGGREGVREGGREGGRDRGREGQHCHNMTECVVYATKI